ncbi:MAG TPA: MMPL family transporter [Acidimicrobiia bacterium]|nr:MMPL family transporter [Acidimicrobiia bacterium]
MLYAISRYCFRRYRLVISAWILILIGISVLSMAAGPKWLEQGTLENTDSTRALQLLEKKLPEQAARASEKTGRIIFQSDDGIASHQEEIDAYLDEVIKKNKKTKIQAIESPFDPQHVGQISKDGTVAFATVTFESDAEIEGLGKPTVDAAKELRDDINVEFSGFAFANFEFPASELFGILAALVILLIAFGSLVAAGLPIFSALVGIGIGGGLITLWGHVIGVPNFTTNVAQMISIGVGIDYALFIVTRYREALKRTPDREAAAMEAMTTAGAAVLFAGMTVVISLLGMLVINIDFISGLAIGTSTAVAVMVLASLTFVPALLGSPIGRNLDKFSLPHRKTVPDKPAVWVRWSEFIQRRAWFAAALGVTILLVLSIPLLSLRVGVTDEGNGKDKQTTKRAYDTLAKGFGPGFNGPIFTVVDLSQATDPASLQKIVAGIEDAPGVVQVVPSSAFLKKQSAGGSDQSQSSSGNSQEQNGIVPIQVFPSTSPQDEKTTELIHTLREDTIPDIVDGTGAKVYLSGLTAGNVDFADVMAEKVPYFIGAVLLLSFLLLMSVFRSLLVALKAVIMNMLSIGAAYGVVVAIFQWGWMRELFGIGAPGPIEPWAPMMLFAIVFGLSMDYEVFLLSKIKEEYDDTKDNAAAVTHGLAATARVITAAALIMVCVFGSFVLADDRALKLMGLGLSVAVFLDATIVRMLLVPATMELLGDKNWWIPKWLDKIIPQIHVERVRADGGEESLVDAIAEGVSDK